MPSSAERKLCTPAPSTIVGSGHSWQPLILPNLARRGDLAYNLANDKGVDGGKLVEQVRALVAKHEKA